MLRPTAGEVVDSIHTLLVPLQCEVWGGLPNAPYFDSAIQRGTGKGVGVLGIECDLYRTPCLGSTDSSCVCSRKSTQTEGASAGIVKYSIIALPPKFS